MSQKLLDSVKALERYRQKCALALFFGPHGMCVFTVEGYSWSAVVAQIDGFLLVLAVASSILTHLQDAVLQIPKPVSYTHLTLPTNREV